MFAGDIAGGLMKRDAALALFVGRPVAGEMADRRMQRAADLFGAHRRRAFDNPFDMFQRGCALRRLGADRVHVEGWG